MAKATKEITVPAVIKQKFDAALLETQFQKISDKLLSFEYTEDDIPKLKEVFGEIRKVEIKIEDVHKAGKADIILQGNQWDAAKRDSLSTIANIKEVPYRKYTKLCEDVAKKEADREREEKRKNDILNGIESNALNFANKITQAQTTEQLLDIERLINLEKGRDGKYFEFLPNAVLRFEKLTVLIKEQKIKVKELEKEKQKLDEAIKSGDDDATFDIMQKTESIQSSIDETRLNVQSAAVEDSQVTSRATQVFPTVKPKRTTWKYELVDQKELLKKSPELVIINLNDEKVKEVLNTLRTSGLLNDKEEYTMNGIRYFVEKTY